MEKNYIYNAKTGATFNGKDLTADFRSLLLSRRDSKDGITKEDLDTTVVGAWATYKMLIADLNNAVARCYRAFELRRETAHYASVEMVAQYRLDDDKIRSAFDTAMYNLLDMYGLKLDQAMFRPETFYPKAGDFRKDKDTKEYYLKAVGDTAFRKFTERLFAEFLDNRVAMTPEQYKEYRKALKKAEKEAKKAAKAEEPVVVIETENC